MWTAIYFCWRYALTMIPSGGVKIMKYDLSIAIVARIAGLDVLVIDIDGVASFNMTLTKLSTAIQFNIDVKILSSWVNEKQNIMAQWQSFFYEDRFAHAQHKNLNFVKLVEVMSVQSQRLVAFAEVTEKLRWILATDDPVLLKVVVDSKVPVLLMVGTGKGLDEFLDSRWRYGFLSST